MGSEMCIRDRLPRYQAAVVSIQAQLRTMLAVRSLRAARTRRARFEAAVGEMGRRFEVLTVRWQAAARGWEERAALFWAEYSRVVGARALLGRGVLVALPQIERTVVAQRGAHARAQAAVRRETARLPAGASSELLRLLAVLAHAEGALRALRALSLIHI